MTPVETKQPASVLTEAGRIGVVHVVDTLNIGGAERVAVNLANLVPRDRYEPFLCTTRDEGPLGDYLAPDVGRLSLMRHSRLNFTSFARFRHFLDERHLTIVHAHASSLFFCRMAAWRSNRVKVIWHDHYGRCDFNDRPVWLYRAATRNIAGVITVNQKLADWCRDDLGLPAGRVWYVPNLVPECTVLSESNEPLDLPGAPGKRLVCVANLRPQKDHPTLLRAMALLEAEGCGAHLFLVGGSSDPGYVQQIRSMITGLGLDHAVTCMGPRQDVARILSACDIGILSSASEGLPLSLLEYGQAGLPAVATAVGQCSEVLGEGAHGLLVPPGSPEELCNAIRRLLADSALRHNLGERFRRHVEQSYSTARIMRLICEVYETVIGRNS
jgi:glycosyltransferase involved in cell wall biosynthesis